MTPPEIAHPSERWQVAVLLAWAFVSTAAAFWFYLQMGAWRSRHDFQKRMRDHYEQWCEAWRKVATERRWSTPTPPAEVKADRRARKLENLSRRSDNPHERALAADLAKRARRPR